MIGQRQVKQDLKQQGGFSRAALKVGRRPHMAINRKIRRRPHLSLSQVKLPGRRKAALARVASDIAQLKRYDLAYSYSDPLRTPGNPSFQMTR